MKSQAAWTWTHATMEATVTRKEAKKWKYLKEIFIIFVERRSIQLIQKLNNT